MAIPSSKSLLIAVIAVLPLKALAQNNSTPPPPRGSGSACVVAKTQGHSEAIEWVIRSASVGQAILQAKQVLRGKGYEYLFPQANSPLEHGWAAMIKVKYTNPRGKIRISYGCGFSPSSRQEAIQLATKDLRSYSWAWRPKMGYEVVQEKRF